MEDRIYTTKKSLADIQSKCDVVFPQSSFAELAAFRVRNFTYTYE